jgi:hypothetical protein
MASLLSGLKKDNVAATERDSLGGAQLLDSDVYPLTVSMAYLQKSQEKDGKGGALGVFLTFKTEEGKEINQTIYITGGVDKGSSSTYQDKEGKDQYLPGYLQVNGLCLLSLGRELADLEDEVEEKSISVYDFNAKAKVIKKMPVIVPLIGAKIKAGILRQQVSKQVKGDDGKYHPTAETREENEINKFFRDEDNMTVAEIEAQAEEPKFYTDWLTKYKGQVLDKRSKDAPAAGAPGTAPKPAATAGAAKPASSLFGKPAAK